MTTAFTPVEPRQRIVIMDALRGFAVLGIFIANLGALSFYSWGGPVPENALFLSPYDKQMDFLHTVLLEGKFYSIFSFLFGWGMALHLQRLQEKGIPGAALVRRRLAILLGLGLAHIILLWPGDIVAFYALLGFVLLWIRHWKEKTLLVTAIALLLSPVLLYYLKMQFPVLNTPAGALRTAAIAVDGRLNNLQSDQDFFNLVHTMNYIQSVMLNAVGLFYRYADLFFQSRISKVLGMFILGLLMGRGNRYQAILANTRLLRTVAIAGLLVGLPANYFMEHFKSIPGAYYGLKIEGWYATIFYALGVAPLALAYIALFFLAARTAAGQWVVRQLQPAGKMAFTNYLTHSLIGLLLFTGVGLALDRQVGPVYYTVFGVAVFIAQILLCKAWLRRFRYGPVEWLWRSATYGQRQPLKQEAAVPMAVPTVQTVYLGHETNPVAGGPPPASS